MKKKVLAAILAVAMAGLSLTGCGSDAGGDSSSNGQAQTESASQGEEESESEDAGQESAEVEEIVFAYMTQNNIPEAADMQRIEDLVNEYTIEKINTKVHLVVFSNADYMNQVNLMLASGEQLDIFRALGTSHLPYIKDGTALDITEYFDDELKEAKEVFYHDEFLNPTSVNGRVYGINCMGSNYIPGGFTYRSDITDELGIDMSQVKKTEDLTAVFEKVKAAYPDMIIIDPNRANDNFGNYLGKVAYIDPLGDNIQAPVSGVAYQKEPTVVNMYETEDFVNICNLARDWYNAGYYASDAATSTATTAELFMSGNCFGTFCGLGNPKIAAQYTTNYGYSFENVQITESMIWADSTGAWMVNSDAG